MSSRWTLQLYGLKLSLRTQCTNIILTSENVLDWSCPLLWTTWYLVLCQWKGWGRQELLVKWAGLCLLLLCSCGGKCPWAQWLASNTVITNPPAGWEGASGRSVEIGGSSHLFVPSKAFRRALQFDPAARNVRGQSPHLSNIMLPRPPCCSHRPEPKYWDSLLDEKIFLWISCIDFTGSRMRGFRESSLVAFHQAVGKRLFSPHCFVKASEKSVTRKNWIQMEKWSMTYIFKKKEKNKYYWT